MSKRTVAVAEAVGVKVALAVAVTVAVGVGVNVAVALAVGVAVALGLGVGVGRSVITMTPSFWGGENVFRSPSIKKKLSGGGAHANRLTDPGVLLTRSILNSNKVPAPESGTKSFDIPDIRRVRIGPGPGKTAAATFQFPAVSPSC